MCCSTFEQSQAHKLTWTCFFQCCHSNYQLIKNHFVRIQPKTMQTAVHDQGNLPWQRNGLSLQPPDKRRHFYPPNCKRWQSLQNSSKRHACTEKRATVNDKLRARFFVHRALLNFGRATACEYRSCTARWASYIFIYEKSISDCSKAQ